MIPYEATVAASQALDDDAYALIGWEGIARLIEAASPHLMAQALRDAADAMTRETPGAGPWGVPQHEHQAQWLRDQAKALVSA